MRYLSLALAVLLPAFHAFGDDVSLPLLVTSTATYTNVTVTTVTASDIFFMSANGGGNAKLKDLPPDLQKKFGYDPDKAEQAQTARREANSRFVAGVRAAQQVKATLPPPPADTNDAVEIPHPQLTAKSFLGQRAPELIVEKWLGQNPDVTGKFVLVDFWGTWCGPCKDTIPQLNHYDQLFHNQMVIIGISGETEAIVKKSKLPALEYYSGVDPAGRTAASLEIRGLPHCILLDPKGIVRYEGHPGYLNEQILRQIFDKYEK